MKTTLDLRKHHYLKRIGIFLIVIALVVGMVGCSCGGGAPLKYDLTISADPAPSGTATDETNGSPYTAGTVVSVKADANPDYEFAGWTATAGTFANANAEETTFTMPAQDVTVTANFFQVKLIRDWHDLHAVRDNAGDSYLLMNDLDSTTAGYTALASPTANDGNGWQPIGSEEFPFAGSFDGQGYEIRDLFIMRPDETGVGLFGWVSSEAVIESVGVVNADVTAYDAVGGLAGANVGIVTNCYAASSLLGNYAVGGLVGANDGTVSNSYSSGDVTGGRYSQYVGGLVGHNLRTINNCYSTGKVSGNDAVGGLVGQNYFIRGTINDCYSAGNVSGNYNVGGLVGENYGGTVSSSYSSASVSGATSETYVGGLVGINTGTINDCYATESVTGGLAVGGLVGFNSEGTVSNSYSTASVTDTTSESYVGGLVGVNTGTINDCYATGNVNGEWLVGGLVGFNSEGTVNNSYSAATVSVTGATSESYVGGLVGVNEEGTVSKSYSTGSVTGNSNVGGLVGVNFGTVSDSFWDVETSGQATSDGGTGKNTTTMMDIRTFNDPDWSEGLEDAWDIVGVADETQRNTAYIWNIVDGETYPFLGWQS